MTLTLATKRVCCLISRQSNLINRFHHGQKARVNGIDIHYERVGSGDHRVLLMPGALGSARTDFVPQLEGFDRDKFTLIAWDPPGYGNSRPPKRDFNDYFRKDAKSAAELMKTLEIDKYSVLGWSDGGITGMILAAANPDNVIKLVVWGAQAYVTDDDRKLLQAIKDTSKWSPKARAAFVDVYGEKEFEELWPMFVEAYVKIEDLCKADLFKIRCPTFILNGDLDPLVAQEHFAYLKKHIKNSCLYRFPQGKHNIHHKYAQDFNEMVQEFLLR